MYVAGPLMQEYEKKTIGEMKTTCAPLQKKITNSLTELNNEEAIIHKGELLLFFERKKEKFKEKRTSTKEQAISTENRKMSIVKTDIPEQVNKVDIQKNRIQEVMSATMKADFPILLGPSLSSSEDKVQENSTNEIHLKVEKTVVETMMECPDRKDQGAVRNHILQSSRDEKVDISKSVMSIAKLKLYKIKENVYSVEYERALCTKKVPSMNKDVDIAKNISSEEQTAKDFLKNHDDEDARVKECVAKSLLLLDEEEMFKKVTLTEKRDFNPDDPLENKFRLAKGQYLSVSREFSRSIESIDYVENRILMEAFERKKCQLMREGKDTKEYFLFHGTKNVNIESILKDNFRMDLAGKNGQVHGRGIYFSEKTAIPDKYTDRSKRTLLLCRVLLGREFTGKNKDIPHGFDSKSVGPDRDKRANINIVKEVDQILPCFVLNLAASVKYDSLPKATSASSNVSRLGKIQRPFPAAPTPYAFRVVITNLQTTVTQEDIQKLFRNFGILRRVKLINPGHAEVFFGLKKEAVRAVEIFHDLHLNGKPIKCTLEGQDTSTLSTMLGQSTSTPSALVGKHTSTPCTQVGQDTATPCALVAATPCTLLGQNTATTLVDNDFKLVGQVAATSSEGTAFKLPRSIFKGSELKRDERHRA